MNASQYVSDNRHRLVKLIQDLVQRPSENTPPHGAEAACQQYIASILREAGCEPDIYLLNEVDGLSGHYAHHPLSKPAVVPVLAALRVVGRTPPHPCR